MFRAFPIGRGQFAVLAAIVAVSGFGGGLVSGRLFAVPDAQAQGRSTTSINVGAGGLVFRDMNGRILAKLSSDGSGGVFELFNANEQAGARMRASSFGGGFELPPTARTPLALPSPPDRLPREVVELVDRGLGPRFLAPTTRRGRCGVSAPALPARGRAVRREQCSAARTPSPA